MITEKSQTSNIRQFGLKLKMKNKYSDPGAYRSPKWLGIPIKVKIDHNKVNPVIHPLS